MSRAAQVIDQYLVEVAKYGPEDTKTLELAMGRIFRLMSRPYRRGDEKEYERARKIVLDILRPVDELPGYEREKFSGISYARDRLKGAAGD